MNNANRSFFISGWLLMPLLFALFASGCSIEKRTLMSGFHVEHRSKATRKAPAEPLPQQVTSVTESAPEAYASSEAINPDFFEPETNVFAQTRMHAVTEESHRPTNSFVATNDVVAVAIADSTAGTEKTLEASPEFTPRDLNRWRGRAIFRALMSLTAAAIAFISAAIDGFALSYFLGIIFILSAIKWIIRAGKPEQLRKWRDERARARQDRTFKSILIRVLKWLLAIPLSIALFLGLLFSLSGGL
jgi:hypothetical protein